MKYDYFLFYLILTSSDHSAHSQECIIRLAWGLQDLYILREKYDDGQIWHKFPTPLADESSQQLVNVEMLEVGPWFLDLTENINNLLQNLAKFKFNFFVAVQGQAQSNSNFMLQNASERFFLFGTAGKVYHNAFCLWCCSNPLIFE